MCLVDVIVFFVFICLGITVWILISSPYTFDKLQQGDFVNENTKFIGTAPFLLKDEIQLKQKTLFKDLIKTLNENKVDYWITDTTLLATELYQKLMPWEDKITINVLHRDLHKLISLRPMFERNNKTKFIYTKHGYSYCENNIYQYPNIDIFIMDEVNGEMKVCGPLNELGECEYGDALLRRGLTDYSRDLVFPLKKALCEEIEVNIPQNTEKYLVMYYGKDYKNRIQGSNLAPLWNKLTLNLVERSGLTSLFE